MPFGLYMDVHVPIAVTEGLRRRGVLVVTSQEDGTTRYDDEPLLARAAEQGFLLVTQDEDFLSLAPQWQAAGRSFPGIIFAPQLGLGIGRTIEDLELLAQCADEDELRDLVTRLPLR